MISVGQGQAVTLEADFFQYVGGPAAAVSGLTLTIVDPGGATEVTATTSTGITSPATGVYQYQWTIPGSAAVGTHTATWSGTVGSSMVTAAETITVSAIGVGQTWCTTEDVLNYTGATVTVAQLVQAGSDIDVACSRPYAVFVLGVQAGSVCQISAMDLHWLMLACAYQAAWVASQVDLYTRSDVTAVGRGRANVQFTPTAMTLSPKARVTLDRVSWMKSRSVHVPGPEDLDRPWLGTGIGGGIGEGGGWVSLGPV